MADGNRPQDPAKGVLRARGPVIARDLEEFRLQQQRAAERGDPRSGSSDLSDLAARAREAGAKFFHWVKQDPQRLRKENLALQRENQRARRVGPPQPEVGQPQAEVRSTDYVSDWDGKTAVESVLGNDGAAARHHQAPERDHPSGNSHGRLEPQTRFSPTNPYVNFQAQPSFDDVYIQHAQEDREMRLAGLFAFAPEQTTSGSREDRIARVREAIAAYRKQERDGRDADRDADRDAGMSK